jgi:hypothetical protein
MENTAGDHHQKAVEGKQFVVEYHEEDYREIGSICSSFFCNQKKIKIVDNLLSALLDFAANCRYFLRGLCEEIAPDLLRAYFDF